MCEISLKMCYALHVNQGLVRKFIQSTSRIANVQNKKLIQTSVKLLLEE